MRFREVSTNCQNAARLERASVTSHRSIYTLINLKGK